MRAFHSIALACAVSAIALTQQPQTPSITYFHGTRVYIIMPAVDPEEHLPTGPASICLASSPVAQCYTPRKNDPPYGSNPQAKTLQLKPGQDAILFEVLCTGGGSGSRHLLALLEPGTGKYLRNLAEVTFSDESEYRFWYLPSISNMPLLVLADAAWGQGETHFSRHRFNITVYSFDPQLGSYGLKDKYMTAMKYPSFDEVDVINVLEPERQQIIARVQRQR